LIDPLGLVLKAGRWYLVARAEDEVRTFRLSSIQALETLDARFSRQRNFDLAKYWSASTKHFEASVYRAKAHLRVSPLGLRRLQSFSTSIAEEAVRTATKPEADGWMRVTVPIESVEDAGREFLRLGPEAEVLEPAELREVLTGAAQRLAAIYLPATEGIAAVRPMPPRKVSGRRSVRR
jgi:predicted DNA-binding transcriptional regulator YafY